ncbi:MAG: mandelate racemase/muconate lactonizing enzyme family protein [Solirubrobacterales bacterium]
MKALIERRRLAVEPPLQTAGGTLDERELFLLRLEDGDGNIGWGEAAPLEPYDGVSARECLDALERQAEALEACPPGASGPQALEAARQGSELPQALAAVDLALWDMAGRREGRPVLELLTDRRPRQVEVNAVVGAGEPAACAARALEAVEAGFGCVKVKVGDPDGIERVRAVREAIGDGPAIRVDANGAWSVPEAVRELNAMAVEGVELAEEPVHGVEALRDLRGRVSVPVAADETASDPGVLGSDVADAICLKVSAAGGISGLLAQAELARSGGTLVYVASTLDGPLGIAAGVHCAAALGIALPCGLATLDRFPHLDPGVLAPEGGAVAVPTGPGLGVEPPPA